MDSVRDALDHQGLFLLHDLINCNLPGDFRKVLEEAFKQFDSIFDIVDAGSLPYAVHTHLGISKVQSPCTQGRREHRTNSAPATGVISYNKELQGHLCSASSFLNQHNTRRVGSITGVSVDLDHSAFVHLWLVVSLYGGWESASPHENRWRSRR